MLTVHASTGGQLQTIIRAGSNKLGQTGDGCGVGALEVGDVSVHHGWTLHNAPGQAPGTEERVAFSVSFFADGARVLDWKKDKSLRKELQDFEDFESFELWYKDLEKGGIARHKDIPILPEA